MCIRDSNNEAIYCEDRKSQSYSQQNGGPCSHTRSTMHQSRRPHEDEQNRQERPRFQDIIGFPNPGTDPEFRPPAGHPISWPSHQWKVFLRQRTLLCFIAQILDVAPRLICLLYTSDAADERSSVDLGGRRI